MKNKSKTYDPDVRRAILSVIFVVMFFVVFIIAMILFANDTEEGRTLIELCEDLGGNIHIYALNQTDVPCMLPNKTIISQAQVLRSAGR